jgi:hypothetical protein
MLSCHEMKKGQIYGCEECGLKLQVIQECDECGEDAAECGCEEHCTFSCCGEELRLLDS